MFSGVKFSIFLFLSSFLVMALASASNDVVVGGVKPLEGEEVKEAENELQKSLTKLAAGDGPNYRISKVHSATRQVVAGSLTKMSVDLIDSNGDVKQCKVTIWSRPWLPDGITVTFECEGEEKVVKKHSA